MEVGHLPPPVAHTELRGGAALRGRLFRQSYAVCACAFTAYVNVCISAHNLYLCEGWRRCTTLLWAATRSWSRCCWRPRQQWILKTTKVQKEMFVTSLKLHLYHVIKGNSSQQPVTSEQEIKQYSFSLLWSITGCIRNRSPEDNKKCWCVCRFFYVCSSNSRREQSEDRWEI